MADFYTEFNKGLTDVEKVVTRQFQVPPGGTNYDAISIDKLTVADRGMPGGKFHDVSTVLHVRVAIATTAGIKNELLLGALGERLRVITIEKDGDDSWTVFCGPAGVEIPRLR